MVSIIILYNIIILWDHCRKCGTSLTETSLCGAYMHLTVRIRFCKSLHVALSASLSVSHSAGLDYNSLYTTNIYLCPPLFSFFPTVRYIKRSLGSTMASTTANWPTETVSLHRWRKPRVMGLGRSTKNY